MSLAIQLAFALGVTLLVSVLIGSSHSRGRQSIPGFYFANHELRKADTTNLLLSSPFSLNGILYQAFLGWAIGWLAVLTQVAWCASYLWLRKYGDRIRSLAGDRTLHGALGSQFGKETERAAACATMLGFTLQIGWEVIVGTSVFEIAFPANRAFVWVFALGLALVTASYTVMGGLRGNAKANTAQNWVAALALVALACYLVVWSGSQSSQTGPWDPGSWGRFWAVLGFWGVLTNITFSLLWQFVDMSTWQNLVATAEKEDLRSVLNWSAFWIFLFPGGIGTLVGMFVRANADYSPDTILPGILRTLEAHPALVIFVAAGFVCAMLSTMDGLMLSVAQALTFDVTHRDTVEKVMMWYKHKSLSRSARVESTEAPVVSDRAESPEVPHELRDAEVSVFRTTRKAIFGAAIAGSVTTVLLTRYVGLNIFDVVYVVTSAQLALFPAVWVTLSGTAVSRGSLAATGIWSGLIAASCLVATCIAIGRTDLLTFTPLVALGFATVGTVAAVKSHA